MSLVERAAKRLEELGRAASQQVAKAPTAALSRDDAAPSMVERAVRRIESQEGHREGVGSDRETPRTAAPAVSAKDDPVKLAPRARREPRLGATPADPSKEGGVAARSPGTGAKPIVQLALRTLAEAGYLDPEDPESILANEFRRIKRPLMQAIQGKLAAPVLNANRIMVTSSVPGEGKTFMALNLALSIAMERDSTVLLIDADTTRQSLSQLLAIDRENGLLDVLAGEQLNAEPELLRTNVERLTLLPAGARRQHATELLASEVMARLVERLTEHFPDRILIFDTPPLLGAPEPAVLAHHMGQIIVVVEADSTTHKTLKSALAAVESCPIVTTVLNKTSNTESGYYYYYAA